MTWKKNYQPGPVDIEDIVDAQVHLTFSTELTAADGEAVADFAEEITMLIKRISLSGQTLVLPENLCPHGDFNTSEIKCFIRERITKRLEANYLKSSEVQAGVFEATVHLRHDQYNSLALDITDPRYQGGRRVYIDNLTGVTQTLGHEPQKGEVLRITNIRLAPSTKTPNGKGGTKNWSNQLVADLYKAQT